jgi:hypothetical protein
VTLNALESAVLDTLFAGDHPVLAALRTQLARSDVSSREFTGVGFFTHFAATRAVVAGRLVRGLQTHGVHGSTRDRAVPVPGRASQAHLDLRNPEPSERAADGADLRGAMARSARSR